MPGSLERLGFWLVAVEGALVEVVLCQIGTKGLLFEALGSRRLCTCARGDSCAPATTIGVKESWFSLAPFQDHDGSHFISAVGLSSAIGPRQAAAPQVFSKALALR